MSTQDPRQITHSLAPVAQTEPAPFTQHRLTCTLAPPPPMRMPAESGGFVITHVDSGPDGALVGFSGTWSRRLEASAVGEKALILQIRRPENDEEDLADVWLWMSQSRRFLLLGRWKNIGSSWAHLAAPLIHAAFRPHTREVDHVA